jgi:glycosyltransferase involved in cell wall biosynthesis
MDISVVICAYTQDRWLDLVAAIESLRRQSHPPAEIVVVVDHNAQLLDRVQAHAHDVVAIPNQQLPGLSGARNSGVVVASGEVIAFMDEDATAAPNWLERLASGYLSPSVIGVGGAIVPSWSGVRPAWFPEEFDWVVGCTYRGMPQQAAAVRNLIGCNMSFRRRVLDSIGGFRDGIGRIGTRPLGCEETELCIRMLQRWPASILCYEPSARVYHRVPASRARWGYFQSRCYHEGLSKAAIARLVGAGDALASERAYTLRTLPQAVIRGVAETIRDDDLAGMARAVAIVAGLTLTAGGYLVGKTTGHFGPAIDEWRHVARPILTGKER